MYEINKDNNNNEKLFIKKLFQTSKRLKNNLN